MKRILYDRIVYALNCFAQIRKIDVESVICGVPEQVGSEGLLKMNTKNYGFSFVEMILTYYVCMFRKVV